MTERQRLYVMLGVLGLLLFIALPRFLPKSAPERAAGASATGTAAVPATASRRPSRSRRARPNPTAVGLIELRVADLEKKPGDFEAGRNPFWFAPKPAPVREAPPPRPVKTAKAEPRVQKPPSRPAPKPPAITFTYLGSFGPKDRQIAVFSAGEEVLNAFEGEVVQKKFVVAKIGYESVDIKYTDFPEVPPKRLGIGG